VLLQILDDGRMTDGQGRTVDFKNTLIIMTSNVGSRFILEFDESKRPEMEQAVFDALRAAFKPEFLNRIDETIIFHNLSQEQMINIVDIQFARLAQRLKANDIDLVLSDSAGKLLSEKGYDPVYGARPLKRAIQQYIENPLSLEIVKGHILPNQTVMAEVKDGAIVFSVAR